MDESEIIDVCRLCPSPGGILLNVFDQELIIKEHNIQEVISVTTGIEILANDFISKKICQRCYSITLKIFQFRQDAIRQDRALKEKFRLFLGDKGIKLPNSCITIKKEAHISCSPSKLPAWKPDISIPSTSNKELKKELHSSVTNINNNNIDINVPKKGFDKNKVPFVSLTMGEVENYFKRKKLDMRKFVYNPVSKKGPFKKVAKKRTSCPTKQKTVPPLKISKELWDQSKSLGPTNTSLILTTKKGRKRSISSTNSDISTKLKKPDENTPAQMEETPEKTVQMPNNIKPPLSLQESTNSRTSKPGTQSPSTTPKHDKRSQRAAILTHKPEQSPKLPSTNLILEDSSHSSSNILEETISGDTAKPEFIESLGLTPSVLTTKCHTLLVCNICGSVHNNAFELRKHTSKHMVCQFCKRKFKSIDAKQNHVDYKCEIKNIMNSAGPTVALEKIHLNHNVRKKYANAFSTFEPILHIQEPAPLELVTVEAAFSPSFLPEDNTILLSDDEESGVNSDPFSGIPTPSANMASPAVENMLSSSVAVLKPDIKIKNNLVINCLVENMTDYQLVKDMISLVGTKKSESCEKMSETDLPSVKDIINNNASNTCEFKKLKHHLTTYKIPVTLSNGAFHATYRKNKSKRKNSMATWDDLLVVDVCKVEIPEAENMLDGDEDVSNNIISESIVTQNIVKNLLPNSVLNDIATPPLVTNTALLTANPTVLSPTSKTTQSTTSVDLLTNKPGLEKNVSYNSVLKNSTHKNLSGEVKSPVTASSVELLQNYVSSVRPSVKYTSKTNQETYSKTVVTKPMDSPVIASSSSLQARPNSLASFIKPSASNSSDLSRHSLPSSTLIVEPRVSLSVITTSASSPSVNTEITNNSVQGTSSLVASFQKPSDSEKADLPRPLLPSNVLKVDLPVGPSVLTGPGPLDRSTFRVKHVWELQ